MSNLRIYGFSNESFVDGPGIRVVVFVQGCDNACEHCHNPDSWDMAGGQEHSVKDIIKKIRKAAGRTKENVLPLATSSKSKKANHKKVTGVTFSGGEPFLQAGNLAEVGQAAKKLGLDITTYTGHTYEELSMRPDEGTKALLAVTDYLIDGPYIHAQRDINLKFRGSKNQRIIDMNKTRQEGKIVLHEGGTK